MCDILIEAILVEEQKWYYCCILTSDPAKLSKEEMRRFPDRYIASVKTADGRLLRSGREMRDAFRAHWCDRTMAQFSGVKGCFGQF